jgi:phenylacetate-coenzyme A ligase PaaK-like adenylate-forming protein
LEQFPTIDKFTVAENLNNLIADGVNMNTLIPNQTSGSNGIPLTVYYDKKTLDYRNYAIICWMHNASIQKPRTRMVWLGQSTK